MIDNHFLHGKLIDKDYIKGSLVLTQPYEGICTPHTDVL